MSLRLVMVCTSSSMYLLFSSALCTLSFSGFYFLDTSDAFLEREGAEM